MKRIVPALAVMVAALCLSGCEIAMAPVMLPIMVANDVVGAIQTELEKSEPMPKLTVTWEDGGTAPVPMETASTSIAYSPDVGAEDGIR